MDDFFHNAPARSEAYSVSEFCTRMWRQRRTMFGWGLFFALLIALYMLLCTKPYMAETLIRIESDPTTITSTISLDSEVDFIRSRSMVQMALDALGPSVDVLNREPSLKDTIRMWLGIPQANIFSATQAGLRIEKLQVPDLLLNQKLTLKIEAGGHYTLFDESDRLIYSDVLAASAPSAVTLVVRDIRVPPGSRFTLIARSSKNIITALQRQLKAEPLERREHAGFMHVTFASDDALFAQHFLTALTDSYIQRSYDFTAHDQWQALTRLDDQLKIIKGQLENAEAKLKDFEQHAGTVDMTSEMQLALQQLVDVESQIRIIKAKQRELGAYYTPLHPSQQSLSGQLAFLESERARKQAAIDALPEVQRQLLQYTREVETYKQMYDTTAQKRTDVSNDAASIASYAKIIDPPEILNDTAMLRFAKAISAGFVLGFFCGAIFVYMTYLSPVASLRAASQIAAMSSLPILGKLTRTRAGRGKRVMPLLIHTPTDHARFQDFILLLKNLGFAMFNASNPVLMVAGTSDGHGPAVIAANIASLYAKLDKTLLIDCGMGERGLHSYLRVAAEPGLSDVMIGKAPLDAAVRNLDKNLYLLPGGTATSYGAQLLPQELFSDMLREFAKTFRYVVLYDTIRSSADLARPWMQQIGSVALVLSAGEKIALLQHILPAFEAQANARGLILDDVASGA